MIQDEEIKPDIQPTVMLNIGKEHSVNLKDRSNFLKEYAINMGFKDVEETLTKNQSFKKSLQDRKDTF